MEVEVSPSPQNEPITGSRAGGPSRLPVPERLRELEKSFHSYREKGKGKPKSGNAGRNSTSQIDPLNT